MASSAAGLQAVTKRFGPIVAVNGVTLDLRKGAVHALVGENGAGKSTIVNLLSGALQPDEGTVTLQGEPISFRSPAEAMRAGIATIYQERALIPQLTVGENLLLGRERTRVGLLRFHEANRLARELLDEVRLDVEPGRKVASLPPAIQQLVAIAKALSLDARLLILDEPTAALTSDETRHLFELLKRLRGIELAILYITHRLKEVEQIADEVTVLKDGRLVSTLEASEASEAQIVPLMVGRQIDRLFPPLEPPQEEIVLAARVLSVPGDLEDVSLAVHRGEILGVAGLEGSGKATLARVLAGVEGAKEGEILLEGRPLAQGAIRTALERGVGYVPPDRRSQGLVPTFSVRSSLTLAALRQLSRLGFVRRGKERETAAEMRLRIGIKTDSLETPVLTLSGGNQQKVVLGRVLAAGSRVLICDEPTAGVDVGARAEIYEVLAQLAREGNAIVLVSSDMLELMGLCHRILVMRQGRIVAEYEHGAASEEEIVRAQLPRQEEVVAL